VLGLVTLQSLGWRKVSSESLNKISFLIFALLRVLQAVRDVLSEIKGSDNEHVLSLEETSTKLHALAVDLKDT
jgi:hypothetical protein